MDMSPSNDSISAIRRKGWWIYIHVVVVAYEPAAFFPVLWLSYFILPHLIFLGKVPPCVRVVVASVERIGGGGR